MFLIVSAESNIQVKYHNDQKNYKETGNQYTENCQAHS